MQQEAASDERSQRKSYEPPSWGAPPKHGGFYVEVIKAGQIAEKLILREKPYFVLGRQADADLVAEHPSLSRHHCIIQFSADAQAPCLCDLSSTHGTYLNNNKLQPLEYSPLKDGDVFKLGYSSRLYAFNDASHDQSTPAAAAAKPKKRKEKRSKHTMTWGLHLDADHAVEEPQLDWRSYAETHELTQKQQKTADKIRKLERRKEKLELDSKRIHDKESQFEELTPGQITALLKNEKTVEQLSDEIDELEEAIRTSILEKLNPSLSKVRAEAKTHEDRSDNDDFYDRSKKRSKLYSAEADADVVSAETLVKERDELEDRLSFLKASLRQIGASEARAEEEDALDAFMDKLNADQKRQERHDQKQEVETIAKRLAEIERLLEFVDPDNFYTRRPSKQT